MWYDLALIIAVALLGTLLAYLRQPTAKAFVLMFPIPFTLAYLAVGERADVEHFAGLDLLFAYTLGVWWLCNRLRWPILACIAVAALTYAFAAALLRRLLPADSDAICLVLAIGNVVAALLLIRWLPPSRGETAAATRLPLVIKLPALMAVAAALVLSKHALGGFITTFPMVGVIASYETRRGLWSLVRRLPWMVLCFVPLLAACRWLTPVLGFHGALAAGWVLFFAALALLTPFDADSPFMPAWRRLREKCPPCSRTG